MRLPVNGWSPQVDDDAWVAPGVTLVGDVRLAAGAGVWFGSVLRADGHPIVVGRRTNLQDVCVAHADARGAVVLGDGVTVGHRVVLHTCTVQDDVLVGMGAVVLHGATIGTGSIVAAGAVVREGFAVPPGSLVAGVPAVVRRDVTDEERASIAANAQRYVDLAALYRSGSIGT